MPTSYKVLGQSAPAATTNADLYVVPSSTEAVVSSIAIANRGSTATTYRVAVRPDGASLSNQHYLVYDASIPANSTVVYTMGVTVDAADVVTVYAGNANLSFQAYGSEITA